MTRHPLLKSAKNFLITLPVPSNLSSMWNFGSILAFCLMLQIVTGFFLAMHYIGDPAVTFSAVGQHGREVNYGNLIRCIHANGASLFFICMYLHIGRGIYMGSFKFMEVWNVGVLLLFATMATAFLGYVLPWGQMSFWGATVITSLISVIPYIGMDILMMLWGGFSVQSALTRFFSFHFILPMLMCLLVMIHLICLHTYGSSNPLGLSRNTDKCSFHPYFTYKDITGVLLVSLLFFACVVGHPSLFSETENMTPADSMITPAHIQPEWYFLFAYAILRSIPNKSGGVLALVLSVSILFYLPLTTTPMYSGMIFYPLSVFLFWSFMGVFTLLTWIGAQVVEPPFILLGQILTSLYFLYFFTYGLMISIWNKALNF